MSDIGELKEAEEKFKSFAENAITGVYAIQEDVLTYVNPKFAEIFGYEIEDCLNKATLDMLVYPADLDMVKENVRKRMSGENLDAHYELRGIKKTGEIIDLEVYGSRGICNGKPCVIGTVLDITERKTLEENLRLYGKIAEELTEGILFVRTSDNIIVFANPKLEKLFGYDPGELTGKNVSILNSPTAKSPKEQAREISDVINEKGVWSGEIKNIKKDGTPLWCYASVSIFEHREYGQIGISIHTDITDRKKFEQRHKASEKKTRQFAKELKKLHDQLLNLTIHQEEVREVEKVEMAREIHDELGQALIALKMNLSGISKKLSQYDIGLFDALNEKINDVDVIIQAINRMCTELRPSLLDNLGLEAAIEWKSEEFQRTTGIDCKFFSDHDDGLNIEANVATALFRVFEGALSNIRRHSGASQVGISLARRNNRLILDVTDNGKGITEEQISNAHSFGILRMRERMHALKGNIHITGAEGEGTTVKVTVPLSSPQASIY